MVIGLTSLILIGKMSRADQKLYTDSTVPLPELSDIAVSFQRMRVASRDFINAAGDAENRAKFERQIGDLSEEVTRTSELYEKGNLSPEMTTAFTEYKQARKAYDGYLSNIISLAKAGKDKEAWGILWGEGYNDQVNRELAAIDKMEEMKVKEAKQAIEENNALANAGVTQMTIEIFLALGLAIGASV